MATRCRLESWLRNCYRCANMTRTHYIVHGVDEGAVRYGCPFREEGTPVEPWHIDGCKRFREGSPQEAIEGDV